MLKEQVKITVLASKVVTSPFARGYCRQYRLQLSYHNKTYNFTYNDSVHNYINNKKLDKTNALWCVLMDANSIEYTRDREDFMREFGYIETAYNKNMYEIYKSTGVNYLYQLFNSNDVDNFKAGLKAYDGCLKAWHALHDIFTPDELKQLDNEFEGY